jgi:hypothetical protein
MAIRTQGPQEERQAVAAFYGMTPNPSIERTVKIQLRWLSPAAHVKR